MLMIGIKRPYFVRHCIFSLVVGRNKKLYELELRLQITNTTS